MIIRREMLKFNLYFYIAPPEEIDGFYGINIYYNIFIVYKKNSFPRNYVD